MAEQVAAEQPQSLEATGRRTAGSLTKRDIKSKCEIMHNTNDCKYCKASRSPQAHSHPSINKLAKLTLVVLGLPSPSPPS